MTDSDTKITLRKLFWDYNFSEDDLRRLLNGEISYLGFLNREKLLLRMIQYLHWYDFVKIMPPELFLQVVNERLIEKLNNDQLERGLRFVREFLYQRNVSVSG